MAPIETLMNEHRLIESVLDALEAYVARLGPGSAADPADLGRFVRFIRSFADECHHGKEEDILFETMVRHGMSRDAGPIAVMLHEHDQGRSLVKGLADLARSAGSWTDVDCGRIRQYAIGYSDLLRHHIQKEDGILYPMAMAQLSPAVMDEVDQRFESFEQEQTGAGEHEQLHRLAEELIARYSTGSATGVHSHP